MPVSPQDFELYSRFTGAPLPRNEQERYKMAPEVHRFTQNFARQPQTPNIFQQAAGVLGKAALLGAAGAGMYGLAKSFGGEEPVVGDSAADSAVSKPRKRRGGRIPKDMREYGDEPSLYQEIAAHDFADPQSDGYVEQYQRHPIKRPEGMRDISGISNLYSEIVADDTRNEQADEFVEPYVRTTTPLREKMSDLSGVSGLYDAIVADDTRNEQVDDFIEPTSNAVGDVVQDLSKMDAGAAKWSSEYPEDDTPLEDLPAQGYYSRQSDHVTEKELDRVLAKDDFYETPYNNSESYFPSGEQEVTRNITTSDEFGQDVTQTQTNVFKQDQKEDLAATDVVLETQAEDLTDAQNFSPQIPQSEELVGAPDEAAKQQLDNFRQKKGLTESKEELIGDPWGEPTPFDASAQEEVKSPIIEPVADLVIDDSTTLESYERDSEDPRLVKADPGKSFLTEVLSGGGGEGRKIGSNIISDLVQSDTTNPIEGAIKGAAVLGTAAGTVADSAARDTLKIASDPAVRKAVSKLPAATFVAGQNLAEGMRENPVLAGGMARHDEAIAPIQQALTGEQPPLLDGEKYTVNYQKDADIPRGYLSTPGFRAGMDVENMANVAVADPENITFGTDTRRGLKQKEAFRSDPDNIAKYFLSSKIQNVGEGVDDATSFDDYSGYLNRLQSSAGSSNPDMYQGQETQSISQALSDLEQELAPGMAHISPEERRNVAKQMLEKDIRKDGYTGPINWG